jgi:hypothetical protein
VPRWKNISTRRVARALGDVSYATVWRVADRNNIELTAGRKSGACCFTGAAHFRTALL